MQRLFIKPAETRVIGWLFFVLLLVVLMVVLGGATRLTNSGLSITEWRPFSGAIPPLSHDAWVAEFEKYKQIPEASAEHPDMTLTEFEFIYFMEWWHRQLGRFIGLAFALPFIYFSITKRLPKGKFWRFFTILSLIGVQGGIGWWMVSSGLVNDRVDVSQYRLAVHLGLAFVILGCLYWLWADSRDGFPVSQGKNPAQRLATTIAGLSFIQIIAGAFVAGTHSGKSYNTWPLMDGGFFPNGYGVMEPAWRNIFENTAAIQFNHRILAYLLVILTLVALVRFGRGHGKVSQAVWGLLVIMLWQAALGIWTLLMTAPLGLSLLHQFSSILVFLGALRFTRVSRIKAY